MGQKASSYNRWLKQCGNSWLFSKNRDLYFGCSPLLLDSAIVSCSRSRGDGSALLIELATDNLRICSCSGLCAFLYVLDALRLEVSPILGDVVLSIDRLEDMMIGKVAAAA